MRTPSSVRSLFIVSAGLLLCATAACGAMDSGTSESMGATSAAGGTATSKPASAPMSSAPMSSEPMSSERMSSEPMMDGTEIIGGDSTFGTVLFDSTGQAVYIFDVETTSTPACYDECAQAWPPVLTEGAPAAGAGAQPELLGTTSRTDGATQVTYAGHPLYYYAHEGKHEVKCHEIALNGGTWFAVQLDGMRAA